MVSVWWGTQADEAFPEAWHSDTRGHAQFRSKVYLSPRLWYLRVNVIEAQDLANKGVSEPVLFSYRTYRIRYLAQFRRISWLSCLLECPS